MFMEEKEGKKTQLAAFFNVGIGCRVTSATTERHYDVTVLKCFTGTKPNQEGSYDLMHSALLLISSRRERTKLMRLWTRTDFLG